MDTLSPFTRKFVALGLLFVVISSAVNLILAPLAILLHESLTRLADSRFQRIQIEHIAERPVPVTGNPPTGLYVTANSAQDAVTQVTNRIRSLSSPDVRLVGASGGAVDPLRPNQVTITLAIEGKEVALVGLVNALEERRPLFRFSQWRIAKVEGKVGEVRLDARLLAVWGKS